MPVAKSKRAPAERAAEHYLRDVIGCVVTIRAVRTQWQRTDIFASDVVGKLSDGSHVYAQVTAGQAEAVRTRRRKLDAIPWHLSDRVILLQLVETKDPANKRRKWFHFRIHRLTPDGWKVDAEAVRVPVEWFRACDDTLTS